MQVQSNLIQQYNANPGIVNKALTTAIGSGGALIPQNLEEVITDTVIRMSPEVAMATSKKISGKFHDFNRKVRNPGRGGAMGENSTTPVTSSVTKQAQVECKIIKRKGKVTGFIQDTAESYIDSVAYETENEIQAHVYDLVYYLMYGNAAANQYEFSGLEQFIRTNRVPFSASAGGEVPTTLAFMDEMLNKSTNAGGAQHTRAWLMSTQMLSKVSSLLTNVRLNQVVNGGLSEVGINGGWRLNAYRSIPIIETTSTAPVEALSSAVTVTSDGTTGGAFADGTYYFYVVPMTNQGEQLPSAEKSVTLSGGGSAQKIKIDLDTPHGSLDYEGNLYPSAYSYKIYFGTVSGITNATLLKQVSAFTYDADGTMSGDNGVDASISITTAIPGADVPTHMQADNPFASSGGINAESIVLWDTDPIGGLGKFVYTNQPGDRFDGLLVTKPLAETDDYSMFMMKTYGALTPSYERSSYVLRNIRPQ